MRIQFICLTLAIVLLCPSASGQWVRTNGLDYDNVVALAVSGRNLLASTINCQNLCIGITYLSADTGKSWVWVGPSLDKSMVSSFAVLGTNLFAGTGGGSPGVYRSTDNGVSWTVVDSIVHASCFAVSGSILFAASGPRVFVSADTGRSWIEADSGLTNGVRSLVVSKTYLFAGTAGSGVFLSTNNGTSWAPTNSGLTHRNIWSLAVYGTNLFAVTDSGGFLSTNRGTTWTLVDSGLTNANMIVLCPGNSETNIIKSIGSRSLRSVIFSSTDDGTSWTEVDSGLYGFVTCLAADATDVYAGTYNGVWLRPLSELFTSVQASTVPIPTSFELCQNYPNPFNPTTTIKYELPKAAHVILTVFDILGREVSVLLNDRRSAGVYEFKFDGTNLASGVYLYRLHAGNFVQTKKMLILK